MKKVLAGLAGALMLGALTTTAASAAPALCTEIGCAGVAADGYIIVLDGDPANPDPIDGFIGVTDGGGIDCDGEGGPYTTGTPQDAGCNP